MVPMTWFTNFLPSTIHEYAGEGIDFYEMLFTATAMVAANATIIFKVHPALFELSVLEGIEGFLHELGREHGIQRIRIELGRLEECIGAADVLVCPAITSVEVDAFERNRPSIVCFMPFVQRNMFRSSELPTANEMARREIVRHALNFDQLIAFLRESLEEGAGERWLERARLFREEIGTAMRSTEEKCRSISEWIANEAPPAKIQVPDASRYCPSLETPQAKTLPANRMDSTILAELDSLPKYYRHIRQEILEAIPRGCGKLLDVGCAAGVLGNAVRTRDPDCRVTGLEMMPDAASIASRLLDRFWITDIESFKPPFQEGEFDCIVFADILEHTRDPWSIVRTYRRFLRPGGTMVVSIPNIRYLAVGEEIIGQGRWQYADEGILDRTHLRFFTLGEFKALLEGEGMETTSIRPLMGDPRILHSRGPDGIVRWGRIAISSVTDPELVELGAFQFLFTSTPRIPVAVPETDLFSKADALFAEGRHEEALALVANLPPKPESLKRTGSILFALGRYAEATVQFHLLSSMAPDDMDVHGALAALSLRREDMERAEIHLSRILERDPTHAEALFGMMRVFATRGDRAEAARFGRRFLESAPEDSRCADVRSLVGSWTAATTTDSVTHRGGPPEVSIIIPVHGRLDLTQQCLKSLEDTIDHSATEIIVVDDASPDGTDSWLREQVSAGRLKAIFLPGNMGFSKACNAGARLAAGRDLVFLNNDTIARAGWLDALRDDMRAHPECGLAGSRLLYSDGRIQHAGIAFGENRVPDHPFRFAPADAPEVTTSGEVPAVTGACILVPADFFASIGGFDEAYPLYVEDVDLCMKVWEAGRSVRYVAQSVLVHLEGSSSTDLSARAAKSRAGLERMWSLWNDRWPEPVRQHPWAPSWQKRKMPSPAAPAAFPSGTAIRWSGPMFNFSGYGRLAREAVAGLMDFGVPVTADPLAHDPLWFKGISESDRARWTDLLGRVALPGFLVCCDLPRDARGTEVYDPIEEANPGCSRKVCWTMFETDRLPPGWADSLNKMDEVWVPSSFNRQTFAAAGVDAAKIHVVPGGIDPAPYANARPMALPGHKRGTTFLSVFQWIRRKGWDVLLRAWAEAFAPNADVRLVLRCHPFGKPASEMRRIFDDSLRGLGLTESGMAPIVLLDGFVPESELPSLYAASDVFVLPSRGEGWGLPYLEAMAAGKPCIATAWGASMEFLNEDCAWLVPPREPVPVGDAACLENPYLSPDHRWADPSPVELAQILRHAFEHPEEGRAKGRQGRLHATSKWTPARTAAAIAERLANPKQGDLDPNHNPPKTGILTRPTPEKVSIHLARVTEGIKQHRISNGIVAPSRPDATNRKLSVRWEGSQFVHHSLAHVNREFCLELSRRGHELSLVPFEPDTFDPESEPRLSPLAKLVGAPLSGPCDVHVRHQWPPDLSAPKEGRWLVIQPWEFGSPPADWMQAFTHRIDELWAYTRHVRDMYLEAGVPPEIVKVVPLGVDTEHFHPQTSRRVLRTRKSFKFLFVGGTIARKGFDILLNAWKEAFRPGDDVCLVIKDMGGKSFYQGQTGSDWVRELQASGRCAEIEFIEDELAPSEMPGLYTACDVLVHPYRGEGFGLPIAEAMACGLPCIVTRGGAADDFCGETESWGVQAKRVPVPGGKVGPFETVSPPWWLEPSVPDLVEKLRIAKSDHEARRSKGDAARRRIVEGFTWDKAAAIAEERLLDLASRPPRHSASGPRFVSALDKLSLRITNPGGKLAPAASPALPGTGVADGEVDLAELNRLLVRAEAAAARGELGEAEHLTEDAVARFPHQNLAWLARAMVLRGLGKFRKASEAIDRAIKERETPEALLESLQIHLLAGDAAPARKIEKALKERHAAWFKETRELFRTRGQTWPPDLLKPARAANKPAPPTRKGKR